jgi:hypothetical protein
MLKAGGMTVSRASPVQCLPGSLTRPSPAQIKLGQYSLRWRLVIASRGDADSLAAGRYAIIASPLGNEA